MSCSQAPVPHGPVVGNRLIASLSPDSRQRFMEQLSTVPLELRATLYTQDGPMEAAYFPLSGMVSMVSHLGDGMRAEVGIVGREGMLGSSLITGVDTSFIECMVQLPGQALRIEADAFRREQEANPQLAATLLRYSEALLSQVMQTAACNGRHDLEQRMARWLLMAHDRVEGGDIPLTQEFIAMMLGVHRPSVTVTAGILQRAGIIRYAAGTIKVIDRALLEAASCECYGTVQRRYASLLSTPGD